MTKVTERRCKTEGCLNAYCCKGFCRLCWQRNYFKNPLNKEKRVAHTRKWQQNNKEKTNEKNRKHYHKGKELLNVKGS